MDAQRPYNRVANSRCVIKALSDCRSIDHLQTAGGIERLPTWSASVVGRSILMRRKTAFRMARHACSGYKLLYEASQAPSGGNGHAKWQMHIGQATTIIPGTDRSPVPPALDA